MVLIKPYYLIFTRINVFFNILKTISYSLKEKKKYIRHVSQFNEQKNVSIRSSLTWHLQHCHTSQKCGNAFSRNVTLKQVSEPQLDMKPIHQILSYPVHKHTNKDLQNHNLSGHYNVWHI